MISSLLPPINNQSRELALAFGKYRGWDLSTVAASDPDYCRWLLKQPFVRHEFPALHQALEALDLPQRRVRAVRVQRCKLGDCRFYTFPREPIVRPAPGRVLNLPKMLSEAES